MSDNESDLSSNIDFDAFIDGEKPTDPTMATLWAAGRKSRERSRNEQDSPKESPAISYQDTYDLFAPLTDSTEVENDDLKKQQALPIEARLLAAARDIGPFGKNEVFKSLPLFPNRQYPSLLTRIPIFRPSRRVTQQSFQDTDNAISFETPWGVGRRHGPPLTIRDEDTLIALLELRSRCLSGPSSHLPDSVRDIYKPKDGKTHVHRVTCSIDQINTFLELKVGGSNYRNTLSSLKRLNACKIEIENLLIDGSRVGGSFDLVKIQWRVFEERGLVDAVFPPLMAHWLKESYTPIDWAVRKELSAIGKALHRFLSGQREEYSISLEKLAVSIGYDGRANRKKTSICSALDELVALGWLKSYRFKGNGRTSPFIASITRNK